MIVVMDNIRSLYNVGAILRTSEFMGIKKVILLGVTAKRKLPNGNWELNQKVNKTSLGASKNLEIILMDKPEELLIWANKHKYWLVAVEQDKKSIKLDQWQPRDKMVLVLGNEVDGVNKQILETADEIVEIPRQGRKNSLNVSVAAGIVLAKLI